MDELLSGYIHLFKLDSVRHNNLVLVKTSPPYYQTQHKYYRAAYQDAPVIYASWYLDSLSAKKGSVALFNASA